MGANINYDADFDSCKTELGKIGSIDYELIEKNCRTLLTEKSKDIRLLCFLSYVYLRDAKWDAFADVFEGFSRLARQNYDALFPDRERAKQLAIKWLSEPKYNEAAAEKKPEEKDYEHISRLLSSLSGLKAILEPKFPEGSPFPSGFYATVQNWEKACKPKPKPAAPAGGAGGAGAELMDTPKQAQTIARKAAFFLIEKEPQKAMGFRLMRCLRWDILEKAPPAENGKTQLAPPPADLAASLGAMISNKEFKPAFDKAETAFTAGANHLWLGLQRFSALACRGLGETYKPVEQAILLETGLLVKRIPDLLKLSFSDGTPFCDDAAKEWIAQTVMPLFGQADAGTAGKGAAGGDRLEEEKKRSLPLPRPGRPKRRSTFCSTP